MKPYASLIEIASDETRNVLNEIFSEISLKNDEYIITQNDCFYIKTKDGLMQITFKDSINIQVLIATVMTYIARQIKQNNSLHKNYALWMKLYKLKELAENCPATVIPISSIMDVLD